MCNYKVSIIDFNDLTEDEKEIQPNNGRGKDYAQYLKIEHNGRTIAIESDAMEPEDVTFSRDLYWIKSALEKAYELGKNSSSEKNDEKTEQKLKTLEEHNISSAQIHKNINGDASVKNGIACPLCGAELLDSRPSVMLTSWPPKKDIKCDNCKYTGYRNV